MILLEERPDLDEPLSATIRIRSVKRGVGSVQLAVRLAFREVRHRWGRTIMVVLLVATPVAGMAFADMNYTADHGSFSNRGWLGSADARLDFGELTPVPAGIDFESVVAPVLPFGADSLWVTRTGGAFRREGGDGGAVYTQILDLDLRNPLTKGMVGQLDGRVPTTADEVLLSTTIADRFGVEVGDELTLVRPRQSFTVVGIADQRSVGTNLLEMVAPGFDFSAMAVGYVSKSVLLGGETWAARADRTAETVRRAANLTDGYADGQPEQSAGAVGVASLVVPITYERRDGGAVGVGWLYGTLAMAVLGVIVAAAFAVSGRRQLTTVGQLSAQGMSASTIRWFLVLQGSVTGVIGAALGIVVGRVLWRSNASPVRLSRSSIDVGHLTVIALTATVVATVAALLPSRSLARISVLTALAGRRPVGRVPRLLAPIGLLLTVSGLAGIVVSVVLSRHGSGNASVLAILGASATFAGVCSVCPPMIHWVSQFVGRRPGPARLAARSLVRHRPRSAALLASIIAVGAAGTALATYGERQVDLDQRISRGLPADVISLSSYPSLDFGDDVSAIDPAVNPELAEPAVRQRVESIVGPVHWTSTRRAMDAPSYLAANYPGPTYNPNSSPAGPNSEQIVAGQSFDLVNDDNGVVITNVAYVESDELLDLLQVDPGGRETLREHGALFVHNGVRSYAPDAFSPRRDVHPAVVMPGAHPIRIPSVLQSAHVFADDFFIITDDLAKAFGLDMVGGPVFARASAPITQQQIEDLLVTEENTRFQEAAQFGEPTPARMVQFDTPPIPKEDRTFAYRASISVGALLLVLMVIGIGMALWAAEGRDEQRKLATIGASPQVLARMTAWRALILTATGVVVAVPLGYGTVWMIAKGLGGATRAPVPWLVGGVILVVIPLLVAGLSYVASLVAQRSGAVRLAIPED